MDPGAAPQRLFVRPEPALQTIAPGTGARLVGEARDTPRLDAAGIRPAGLRSRARPRSIGGAMLTTLLLLAAQEGPPARCLWCVAECRRSPFFFSTSAGEPRTEDPDTEVGGTYRVSAKYCTLWNSIIGGLLMGGPWKQWPKMRACNEDMTLWKGFDSGYIYLSRCHRVE